MDITSVKNFIKKNYSHVNPGVQRNLLKIYSAGALAGVGRLLILPVDQGIEHGPVRAFGMNKDGLDPLYHFQLAKDCGFSALAAPAGLLETCAGHFIDDLPLILKLNSNNLLAPSASLNQATSSAVSDALRLGCSGVGFTIYPGSRSSIDMIERAASIIKQARKAGLVSVIWSYPRSEDKEMGLSKDAETAIDVVSYAAHIAAQLGADIIKVKLPSKRIYDPKSVEIIKNNNIKIDNLSDRVRYVMQSCFAAKRIVLFSGGEAKNDQDLLYEIEQIKIGGGSGSIIGRNSFQRSKDSAQNLLKKIAKIYNAAS